MAKKPTEQLGGMPPEAPPVPKVYISGTPTPDKSIGDFNVDDKVLVEVVAMVTKKGEQHQQQGKGLYINVNVSEIKSIRRV